MHPSHPTLPGPSTKHYCLIPTCMDEECFETILNDIRFVISRHWPVGGSRFIWFTMRI